MLCVFDIAVLLCILGRYFACSTHTIAVNVTSKRSCDKGEGHQFMYYVNDGVYGSFNCILFDHTTPTPAVLKVSRSSEVWWIVCAIVDHLSTLLRSPLDPSARLVCGGPPVMVWTNWERHSYQSSVLGTGYTLMIWVPTPCQHRPPSMASSGPRFTTTLAPLTCKWYHP